MLQVHYAWLRTITVQEKQKFLRESKTIAMAPRAPSVLLFGNPLGNPKDHTIRIEAGPYLNIVDI